MNKNNINPLKSRHCKLSDNQQVTIFAAFDAAAKVINKKTSYIRRFSEPRKNGLGYRCKFWGVKLNDVNTAKLLDKIRKVLPDGYTAELSSGSWTYDIIIRTPKFTAESTETIEPTNTVENGENTIVKTWSNVDFQAPMCPPMTVTVYCEIELDPAGNVVSKEATDLVFSCADMPEATSEELGGTMSMMSGLLGVHGIKDAIVDAGREGLEKCVKEAEYLHKQGRFVDAWNEANAEGVEVDHSVEPTRHADDTVIDRLEGRLRALEQMLEESQETLYRERELRIELEAKFEDIEASVTNLDITELLIDALNHMDFSDYAKFEMVSNGTIKVGVDVDTLAADIAYNVNEQIVDQFSF